MYVPSPLANDGDTVKPEMLSHGTLEEFPCQCMVNQHHSLSLHVYIAVLMIIDF